MEPVLLLLVAGALVGGGTWMQYRKSEGRIWGPLWTAFSLTAAAILFLVAGATGYELQGGLPFSRDASWTGAVIWSQIAAGGTLCMVSAPLWWIGVRSLR